MQIKDIKISDYTYDLPEHKIAKYPKEDRDKSKLLYLNNEQIMTTHFRSLPTLLKEHDMLFFNNAKVIQARLLFRKETGAKIEIFCLKPYNPADYNLSFQSTKQCEWECLVKNLKKWKNDVLFLNLRVNNIDYKLEAKKQVVKDNSVIVKFTWHSLDDIKSESGISFGDILDNLGETPLPPYLNREAESQDKIRYQTVYAKREGSVAAPTAGLHFTDTVLDVLAKQSIDLQYVTLHVGAGTFRPVKSETISGHDMHEEHFEISHSVIEAILKHKGRIIAVGTTSVRTLESVYWIGVKLIKQQAEPFKILQWETYDFQYDISFVESLTAVKTYMEIKKMEVLQASTEIIIVPEYKFKIIDALITNFHQPQSTLLLLIAAILGDKWKEVYQYALNNEYRFLSYGDSSFFEINASAKL